MNDDILYMNFVGSSLYLRNIVPHKLCHDSETEGFFFNFLKIIKIKIVQTEIQQENVNIENIV